MENIILMFRFFNFLLVDRSPNARCWFPESEFHLCRCDAAGYREVWHTSGPKDTEGPLSAALLEEMTQFLHDNGGGFDYGKFANRFQKIA